MRERMTVTVPRPLPHILLVDDDPAVRDATRLLLAAGGFRVSVATDAETAERIVVADGIDAVVTDYFLANDCSGAQVVDRLRRVCGHGLKAIMVTGDPVAAARELRRDGAIRLLSKPVQAEEFLAVLNELLGR
jgi:DNA-binding NtrC family response regulator